MKKREVDHVLRAAGRITDTKRIIIIGSQSLHGKFPDMPDAIHRSMEVDLIVPGKQPRTEWLNVIGEASPFHESFGYYADSVATGLFQLHSNDIAHQDLEQSNVLHFNEQTLNKLADLGRAVDRARPSLVIESQGIAE